ncbi:MAG: 30S ribosomal protein S8 [Candidatus Gracilibacteria bacterium]|nr:30S ribosomal protein S8 [Candidatus Gracilibacteria bacterium]
MSVDPIADFLTRIRNAQTARSERTEIPYSKLKHEMAKVMLKNEFLKSVHVDESGKFKVLILELPEKKLTLKRVSKCGQRIYTSAEKIRKVLSGYGISIVSTSKGLMTGYEARKQNVGGEVLCEVS